MKASNWERHLERTVAILSAELNRLENEREILTSHLEKFEDTYQPGSALGPTTSEALSMAREWVSTLRKMLSFSLSSLFMVVEEDLEAGIPRAADRTGTLFSRELAEHLLETFEILKDVEKLYSMISSRTYDRYSGAPSSYDGSFIRLHLSLREKLLAAGAIIVPIFAGSMAYQRLVISKLIKEFILLGIKT